MPSNDQRERAARRLLAAAGLILKKTPARSAQRDLCGVGYMIIRADTNTVVSGSGPLPYWDTIEDVEAIAAEAAS